MTMLCILLINRLRDDFVIISEWFYENYTILIPGFSLTSAITFMNYFQIFFNNTTIENVSEEKILGLLIEKKLSFKTHIKNIHKKG